MKETAQQLQFNIAEKKIRSLLKSWDNDLVKPIMCLFAEKKTGVSPTGQRRTFSQLALGSSDIDH
jgi:hypothetical protein